MLTFNQLVAQLRDAQGAGFDVSATQAGIVLNRSIKRLATASKWIREEREFGPAVAGQDTYPIPADIVDIHELIIAGEPSQRASTEDVFRLKAGSVSLRGGPPWTVFCQRSDATGTKLLGIFPAPAVNEQVAPGASLLALCSVSPADIQGSNVPPFPDDFEDTLLAGAKATLYRDLDENPDEGDIYEQRFDAGAEKLRRRANSRVGNGAFRIPTYRDLVP